MIKFSGMFYEKKEFTEVFSATQASHTQYSAPNRGGSNAHTHTFDPVVEPATGLSGTRLHRKKNCCGLDLGLDEFERGGFHDFPASAKILCSAAVNSSLILVCNNHKYPELL